MKTAEEFRELTKNYIITLDKRNLNHDLNIIELGIERKAEEGLYAMIIPLDKLKSYGNGNNIKQIKSNLSERGFSVVDYELYNSCFDLEKKIYRELSVKAILIRWEEGTTTYYPEEKIIIDVVED